MEIISYIKCKIQVHTCAHQVQYILYEKLDLQKSHLLQKTGKVVQKKTKETKATVTFVTDRLVYSWSVFGHQGNWSSQQKTELSIPGQQIDWLILGHNGNMLNCIYLLTH